MRHQLNCCFRPFALDSIYFGVRNSRNFCGTAKEEIGWSGVAFLSAAKPNTSASGGGFSEDAIWLMSGADAGRKQLT